MEILTPREARKIASGLSIAARELLFEVVYEDGIGVSLLAERLGQKSASASNRLTKLRDQQLVANTNRQWEATPAGRAVASAVADLFGTSGSEFEDSPLAAQVRQAPAVMAADERADALARLRDIEAEIQAALLVEPHRLHNRLRVAVLHPVRDAIEALDARPTVR